jgi:hypothetical protein
MFATKRKNLIIFVIAILVFIADGYLIWSANSENIASEQIISNINTEIIKEVEKTQIQASIQSTNTERQTLDKYFIDQKGEVSFVDSLEVIGNKAGVTLKIESASFENYTASSSTNPMELVHIHLKSTGSWSGVMGFWNLLESTPFRLAVDRVDLQKDDSIKGISTWAQSIDITAYKKK